MRITQLHRKMSVSSGRTNYTDQDTYVFIFRISATFDQAKIGRLNASRPALLWLLESQLWQFCAIPSSCPMNSSIKISMSTSIEMH